MRSLTISALSERLAVCRLDPAEAIPAWVRGGPFWTATGTAEELSVIAAEHCVPPGTRADRGWLALKVEGPFDFSETGVLASLAGPLSEAGISILAIATHDTDYLLVRAEALSHALRTLESAGHRVRQPSETSGNT